MPPKERHPVLAHDLLHVSIAEARRSKCITYAWQISAGLNLDWDQFATQAAVHIRAEGNMFDITREIAYVLDVRDDVGERALLGGELVVTDEELRAEVDADHAAAADEGFDHVIGEMP